MYTRLWQGISGHFYGKPLPGSRSALPCLPEAFSICTILKHMCVEYAPVCSSQTKQCNQTHDTTRLSMMYCVSACNISQSTAVAHHHVMMNCVSACNIVDTVIPGGDRSATIIPDTTSLSVPPIIPDTTSLSFACAYMHLQHKHAVADAHNASPRPLLYRSCFHHVLIPSWTTGLAIIA